MRKFSAATVAILIGLAAVIVPIWLSVDLSWKEAIDAESTVALSYGQDVLRRADETGKQIAQGIALINGAHNPPCSPQELSLMRKVDVGSSYVQAVGRIEGNEILCTSVAGLQAIPLGPPTLITARGAQERLNVTLPLSDHPVHIFSLDGVAFILNPTLALDIPTEGPDISIAIFIPSSANHTIFAARGLTPHSNWFKSIPKGSTLTFRDSGYVVTIARASDIDIAVVTSAPESYVRNRVRRVAFVFVPIGLISAIALAWAIMTISRVYLSLPSVLRGAAKRKEFFVEYQPIVDLVTGRWIGAEALVRWQRGGKIIRPDAFIPVAEETGVITKITECVIGIVTADLPVLLRADPRFAVAINLSAPDLRSERTVDLFKSLLQHNGIRPANVMVEATERGFLDSSGARILASIHDLGIEVSIDDFGTGYSSLSCLQTLKVDALKIDKSFVETAGTDGATSNVVSHIIGMAHSLNLTMIAEGVETQEQADFLRRNGVQFAQGWLFAKAMSLPELCAAIETSPKLADTPA